MHVTTVPSIDNFQVLLKSGSSRCSAWRSAGKSAWYIMSMTLSSVAPSHFLLCDSTVYRQVVFHTIAQLCLPTMVGFCFSRWPESPISILRWSTKFGYCGNSMPTFASHCDEADERLFYRVTNNTCHVLHLLLPPLRNRHYSFRQSTHDFERPDCTSELQNRNFLMIMLFKQCSCSTTLYII